MFFVSLIWKKLVNFFNQAGGKANRKKLKATCSCASVFGGEFAVISVTFYSQQYIKMCSISANVL